MGGVGGSNPLIPTNFFLRFFPSFFVIHSLNSYWNFQTQDATGPLLVPFSNLIHMKRIVTPAEMQDIDRRTIHEFRITGEALMENAGAAVFKVIIGAFESFQRKNIFVFCGKGNNGGDGFVIARLLKENGADPRVFVVGNLDDIKLDARIHFNKLIATGVEPVFLSDTFYFPQTGPDLIVDALLGTGARGPLENDLLKAVETINRWKDEYSSYVLAVDIPSGLNGESGRVENVSVHADATVTMGLPKPDCYSGMGGNIPVLCI